MLAKEEATDAFADTHLRYRTSVPISLPIVFRTSDNHHRNETVTNVPDKRRKLLNIGSGTYFGDLRTWLILAQV